jgi:serine/threonine-protein phosphatase CPPED1
MKRSLLAILVIGTLALAIGLSRPPSSPPSGDLQIQVEARNPWTNLRLNNDPAEFRFAIVSDRTGGHRPRIFSQAVEQLNLLQPEFVLSVGDLIEGYTENPERLAAEWREFQGYVNRLQMPFFYAPGNHDVSNLFQDKAWKEKFGHSYYSFTYRNVLFLILNSDDPPNKNGQISPEQQEFIKKTLEQNTDVRWTIVAIHKPLWSQTNLDKTGWLDVEKALANRPYTVFAGHIHHYEKFIRNGQNYYQLATTGGGSRMRGVAYGEFDQIAWVTMKKNGPVLANILLDGVLPDDLNKPITAEEGVPVYNRKPTHPVHGMVLCEGCPMAGAQVVFHLVNPETKKLVRAADAVTEGDGSFMLTTYQANDGAPAGDYKVTVFYGKERFNPNELAPNHPFPEKYSKPETTPLTAVVKAGKNEITLELKN